MSQVTDCEEHSLKTFQNNGESVSKCHLGTVSTLSWPEGLCFRSALGAKVGGGLKSISRKLFIQQPLPGATQPRVAFPALCSGFVIPFLFSIGSYPFFIGECFWDHGTISSQHTAYPHIHILLGPREGLGGPQGSPDQSTGTGWHSASKSSRDQLGQQ